MRNTIRTVLVTFGMLMVATVLAVNTRAQCGASDGPMTSNTATALLLRAAPLKAAPATASAQSSQSQQVAPVGAAIVGFWHVKFISKGTGFIPDGTVVDMGFSQWHSDNTEILNSSRPPVIGSFCLGVWTKTGRYTYSLNHFALSFNPDGSFQGVANIHENVALSADGNSYSGSFSIDQYDTQLNLLAHIVGNITATRITVNTKPTDLF